MSRGLGVVDLDAAPVAGLVGVGVAGSGVGVFDVGRLDIHGEGTSVVVGFTTSPFDSSRSVVGVTTGPDTESQAHGGLGETASALRIGKGQSADDSTVDDPANRLRGPFNGVGVENLLGSSDGVEATTVIAGSVTLSEVVALNLSGVASKSFLYHTNAVSFGCRVDILCICG
jgi:hypothetical protein